MVGVEFTVPISEEDRAFVVGEWVSGYGAGINTSSDTLDGLIIDIITSIRTAQLARIVDPGDN